MVSITLAHDIIVNNWNRMKILTNNVAGLNQLALVRAKWGSNIIFMACDETLIHPRIIPIYLGSIEDPQTQFHI